MNQTIRPSLVFQDGQAQAASTFHTSLLPDIAILDLARRRAGAPVKLA